jgi:formate dehydrogenase (coenzyme F420) alpha subunit
MAHKLTTCTFCGVGCGIYVETAGNQLVGAYPSMSHPCNQGRICARGWHVHEVASSPDRLKNPLLRKEGQLCEVSWSEAFGFIAARIKEIRQRHGPDAMAFLSSPRCSNEEAYLLQKFARSVIGTNNVDHGTGVYCNNSINVLLEMLGVPATTASIADLAQSNTIIVDGVDLARQMPTIGGTVLRAKLAGAKLIVIDTRRHRLAESADVFLQLKPGTEAILYAAMAKIIVDRGLENLPFIKAHCRNYAEFLDTVRACDLIASAEACGVPADKIEAAAAAYATASAAAILYSTGIDASNAASVEGKVNLALLSGQIAKNGAGIFALTEHNNLQGVCDMGMLPDRLPGYRSVTDAAARAELETRWRAKLPSKPGLASRSLLADRASGQVRALWLCRYDPVSTAFFGDAAKVLEQCELVVVQHLFLTESARYAHVILPTTAFGEEQVTFTNTERRIQLADQAVDPLPGTSPAWKQLTQTAQALGADWKYNSPAEVMDEIGRVIPFYSGANYDNLSHDYGRQWPCTKERPLGTRSLFLENSPKNFKFAPVAKLQPAAASQEFPLIMVFGHSLYYWNQNVLIQHSETLKREYRMLLLDYPEGFVEVNPDDAKQLGIRDGEKIRLRSAAGSALTCARLTAEARPGAIFVPYFVRQVQKQIRGTTENGIQLVPVRIEKEVS